MADYSYSFGASDIVEMMTKLRDPSTIPADIRADLPDVVRTAAKTLANQPELWCRGSIHKNVVDPATGLTVKQSCALGQIDTELDVRYGDRHNWGQWLAISDLLSEAATASLGKVLPVVNDAPDATPDKVADAMYVVADELEFGDV